MFLFRTVFWLSLVVLVLPTDAQQQARLYNTASEAAHHAATFCHRNAATCAKSAELWAAFRQKLEFGARMAVDIATERMNAQPAVQPVSGTLSPSDLAPAWRGPKPTRSGA